ncbi:MAG TPA: hypothetical protein PLU22_21335 [Polyangiaceae bacterium]|nr:hypothetical protein [Polyangiaceae bacterium]
MAAGDRSRARRLRLGTLALLLVLTVAAWALGASPPRVEVVLIRAGAASDVAPGPTERDAALGERIGSLFGPTTEVALRSATALAPGEVLDPAPGATVHVWITVTRGGTARVYLATRPGDDAPARYLWREVALESGLDEVGAETVAQVAHSSVMALWSRGAETPRDELAVELAREPPAPAAAAAAPPGARAPTPDRGATGEAPERPVTATATARATAHHSGDEGWVLAPGLSAGVAVRERWSARVGVGRQLPAHLDAGPASVRVAGSELEARVGATLARVGPLRWSVEAGGGMLLVRWEARAASPEVTLAPREERETRGFGAVGVGVEASLGARLRGAVAAELRLPLQTTRYLVVTDGEPAEVARAGAAPGVSLELGATSARPTRSSGPR